MLSRVLPSLRRPSWAHAQALALVAAALLAYNGARILNDSPASTAPVLRNFDASMPWLGLALLATVVAAWRPAPPQPAPRAWTDALLRFCRDHWLELLLFAAIFGFGVFMRVYRFGDTLPPSDGLCCEEHINGGAAYKALQGEWPLNFLLTRWGSAAGFLVFGETTLGLRFFFVAMSIATLPIFYLLLRQLVSAPVALFGMALYAAAWWPSLRARQPTEGTIYAVLFTLVIVRALKTKSPLMALCGGVLAGLLSYEYEPFKGVPIIAALFLLAAAAREVLLRAPFTVAGARERARALAANAWRPVLVALMATAIVLVPMVVGTHRGYDLYLTSLHRQEDDRGGARFAENWETQLEWAVEIFLPFGPNEYPVGAPRDPPNREFLDPLIGALALAGVVVGAFFLLRGLRGWFVGWVALSLGAAALLLHDFAPWKLLGLVPVLMVLAALFVDDVRALVGRAFGVAGTRAFAGLLVAGAMFSFWWNADALFNDIAPSPAIAGSYGGEKALLYSLCDYLQDRGDENYTVAFSGALVLTAFASPRTTFEEQAHAWGDFIWACHDLDGAPLPAAEEAWPLRDVPSGPVTLAFANTLSPLEGLIEELNRAYPGLGQPDRRAVGPAETYELIAYEFAGGDELRRHGLWGDYLPAGAAAPAATRVDPVNDLSWDAPAPPIAPPFTVRWRGVVYLERQEGLTLRALTDEPVEVVLDGQVIYTTTLGAPEETFVDLLPGWHPVEIALNKQRAGGSFRLVWVTQDGDERLIAASDLFPLAELSGWVQQRTMALPGDIEPVVTQRLDFAPHYVSATILQLLAQTDAFERTLTEERWRGVWHVDQAGEYVLQVQFQSGTVTLLVDNAPVATGDGGRLEADLTLSTGPHAIEIVQRLETDVPWAGAVISASRRLPPATPGAQPALEAAPLVVTPY